MFEEPGPPKARLREKKREKPMKSSEDETRWNTRLKEGCKTRVNQLWVSCERVEKELQL